MELMVILVEVQLAGWLRHKGTMVDTRFKIMQWAGPGPVSNDVLNDGKAEGEPRDSQATLLRMRMMPRLVRVMLNLRG